MHTSLRCALFLLASSTSCAMVLDFGDGNASEGGAPEGGAGAAGGAGAEGGGGAKPKLTGGGGEGAGDPGAESWISSLSSTTEGGAVEIQSLIVRDGTTWISGFFTGAALVFHAADGEEVELFEIPDANPKEQPLAHFATSFVLAIGEDGTLDRALQLTQSTLTESTEGSFAGTQIALDAAGALYVATTAQDGFSHLLNVNTAGIGFNLFLAKVDDEGEPVWAAHCVAEAASGNVAEIKSLSARFADLEVDDGAFVFAGTLQPDSNVECHGVGASPDAGNCDLTPLVSQGVQVMMLDTESGECDASTSIVVAGGTEQGASPIWIDALGLDASGDVVVTGHAGPGPIVIAPWSDNVTSEASVSFVGTLARADLSAQGSIRTFPSDFAPLVQSGEAFAGSVFGDSSSPAEDFDRANDVQLVRGEDVLVFGDPSELLKDEIVESLSVRGDSALITGRLSKGSNLAVDLCGAACAGDLGSTATACVTGAEPNWDAFWLIVDTSTEAPLSAFGRAFGDCANQSLVAGSLDDETVTLVAQVQGAALIDVLQGEPRTVVAETGESAIIVKMPRPDAVAP